MQLFSRLKRIAKSYVKPEVYNVAALMRNNLLIRSSFFTGHKSSIDRIRNIDVEPIARCNLKCPFCQVPGWERADNTHAMDVNQFVEVINQFPRLEHIKLQGMGEPFINKNLPEMIGIASARNIATHVISNGTLLTEKLVSRILESGLTRITFSFDGARQETYESLRVGARYDKVIANMRLLCSEIKRADSKLKTQISCLASTEAVIEEIPALVELASDIGIDELCLRRRVKIWKKSDGVAFPEDRVEVSGFDRYDQLMEEAKDIAKKRGVGLSTDPRSESAALNPCIWPWKSLYVSVEGKIVPCCVVASPDAWCMGDLTTDSLESIWNSQAYRKLRRQINLNKPPEICKTCYMKE